MAIQSVNPTTGDLVASFDPMTQPQLDAALAASEHAFRILARTRIAERARSLQSVAAILDQRRAELARLVTEEMGKPIAAAEAEIEKCEWACRFYAERGEEFLRDREIETDAAKSYVTHLPLGPVLAVMPWNFPFWQVFRFAAPATMAGNTVLLKHASNVPRVALALQEIFEASDFDSGVFRTLLVESPAVESVLADRRVKAATVTGSLRAGQSVAAIAGGHVKKTVLELGGSDAFIVMPSADIDRAAEVAVTSRTLNNGQSCIAAKRFIVHKDVYAAFVEKFSTRLHGLKVGDPLERGTAVGPLAMARTRERLAKQVDALVAAGATRFVGARPMSGKGYFFEPGVVTDVPRDTPCYREEIFGPVALVFEVDDLDEAIEVANDSPYGLGSAIWTSDLREMERAVAGIDAGSTFVNSLVKSDPRLPFGGVKQSGYGRELARDGILEFVNAKTVWMA